MSSDASGNQLWITALGAFDMVSPGDFLTEAQLWQAAAPVLGTTMLDAGMPKLRAEVLVAGHACAPAGRPVNSLTVNLELGPIRKRLAVFGRRWWRHGPDGPLMTPPEPFGRIPLGWNNAFGGPGHAENPLGKGAGAKAALWGGEAAELPMIETPEALITDIEHRPSPAGFGPRAEDAPSRLTFAGAHDDAWLRDGFPGPGRGLDSRYYNAAWPDQQSETEFRGDEMFRITSMHPEHADLRGRLPGFRVRGFAGKGDGFEELRIRCDTVWLLPGVLMGIALFRGGLAVADRDASDVSHVMLAYERLQDPERTLAHYHTAFEERTNPELAALKLLDERPLRPERLPEEVEAVEEERRALAGDMKRRHQQAREHAVATMCGMAGLPVPSADLFTEEMPIEVEPPVVTPGEIERMEVDLAGLTAEIDALADAVEKEGEAQLAKIGSEVARVLPRTDHGLDPRTRSLLEDRLSRIPGHTGESRSPSRAGVSESSHADSGGLDPGLDHLFDRAGQQLGGEAGPAAASRGQAGGGTSAALRRARNRALGKVDEDDPFTKVNDLLTAQRQVVNSGAASVGPTTGNAQSATSPQAENLFDRAREAVAGSRAGAESAATSGSDRVESRIAYCNEVVRALAASPTASAPDASLDSRLNEAQNTLTDNREKIESFRVQARRSSPEPIAPDEPLSEGDAANLGGLALEMVSGNEGLKGRDLAGADLSGVDLGGLDLEGIFLEQARLVGANLAGAKLRKAVLTGADLYEADLSGADLTEANLSGANLARSGLRDARLDRAQLFRSQLDGADMSGASLTEVSLVEASLADTRLAGAVIRNVQFVKCDLTNLALDGSCLNSVVVVESETTGFRAPAARFERCTLIGIRGEDADLTEAEFVRSACIGDAKFSRARMAGLVSRSSGWRGADLSGADLTGARFDESDLGNANLTGACMHRASLKRAVLHKANATGADFYGATLFEAQVREANFTRASLFRANLYSTDLTDAQLTLCDLTGANLALTLMTKPANAG